MDNFDEYKTYFKGLDLKEKQGIILDELKLLTVMTNNMCNEIDANNEIIIDKELVDTNKEEYTESDFAEAVMVYICSIKNSLSDFNIELSKTVEDIEG